MEYIKKIVTFKIENKELMSYTYEGEDVVIPAHTLKYILNKMKEQELESYTLEEEVDVLERTRVSVRTIKVPKLPPKKKRKRNMIIEEDDESHLYV